MRILTFLLLTGLAVPVNADVYKCTGKYGQATYQNTPCAPSKKEQQLDINFDPVKEAEAKAKLEAIRSEYEAKKAAKAEEEKALTQQRDNEKSLEFARRSAIAQQEQAQAQQRQANALERQSQGLNSPIYFLPQARPAPRPTIPFPRENTQPGTVPLPRETPEPATITPQ